MRDRLGKGLMPILIVSLVVVSVLSLRIGAVELSGKEILAVIWDWIVSTATGDCKGDSTPTEEIVLRIRMPRIVLAALVGASLALSGTVYQALFRNPMADPYVIGASAGASLGATIAMMLPISVQTLHLGVVPLFAFIGSIASVATVFNLARVGERTPMVNLILAGVAVGSILSSLVSLLMYLMPQDGLHGLMFWLMGGFSGRNWTHVLVMLPHLVLGLTVIIYYWRELNAILLGEEEALSLGVDVGKVTRRLIAAASLLTAASVASSGIIGFVGLVVPHLVRIVIGPDHKKLIPNACLLGAVFMLAADTVARSIIPPRELPVGIVTSLAGGPFFIYLLRKYKVKEW
ncbi:MAG: iron ABC transporter permease [Bacillota bacterium]|nr:iron ABC transporter permease [Bacillota bacterium]HOO30935.1 iron ABC transporter permease [Bacillota bacterium]